MLSYIGERVVRGPDWEYNDDDGGDGCVGTVIALKKESSGTYSLINETVHCKVQKVTVAWDLADIGDYRTGLDGKYDLACLDVGVGRPHLHAQCDVCSRNPVGYRWLCTVCKTYDLCDACYNKNEHHLDHQFARFSSYRGSCVRAPTRESSLKNRVEARGLFMGAKVSKDGKQGVVVETLSWRNELQWGGVKVLWDGEEEASVHARMEDGVIDIKCEEVAKYGLYYKDHLANFGERSFNGVGDLASVLVDVDEIKQLQEGHGDWIPQMTDSLRQVALITAVMYNGDCKLHFPVLGLDWDFNTEAVTRLEEFGIGDTVQLIDDEEKIKKIQPGHGDWKKEMSQDLGQEGTVLRVLRTGDIKVLVNGHPWTLHPACMTLVRAKEQRNLTEWEEEQQSIILKAIEDQQTLQPMGSAFSSINSMKEDILKFVQNAHDGNLTGVKEALEKNPNWVNIQVGHKTAIHLACSSGQLEVIKYLISKNASIEAKDETGFRPLHCAVKSRKLKVMEYLLKQGAYPSAVSKTGWSPLHLAAHEGFTDCAAILLKHGCNINIQDKGGDAALHVAIEVESEECQKLLIDSPMIDLVLRNLHGNNALHFAVFKNSEFAVNMILDKMPVLALNRNKDGLTSLHIASLVNNIDIARILIEKGRCTIDSLSDNDTTPLFVAVIEGATESVEFLVTHGADINQLNISGGTCMHAIFKQLKEPKCEVDDSLTLRKICASMREIGVLSPGEALACYLVRNGGRLDIPNKIGEKPIDHVVDPKLKECLQQCLETYSPHPSPAPAAKKERNPLLDREVRKRPASDLGGLNEVENLVMEDQVELFINPFNEEASALSTATTQRKEPTKRVVSVLRRQNSKFRMALACTVCFQRKKGVVFECSHSTCKECAELLPKCPVCHQPASKVVPLYL